MGKKKGKKVDVEKKAALQAKKDAKQDKAARKRLQKDASSSTAVNAGSTNVEMGQQQQQLLFEALLEQYKKADDAAAAATAYIETLDGFPLARANATWTLYDDDTKKKKKRNAEIYLFGGEYYDGVENIILNHLLKYDVTKREWKRIHVAATTANTAPAAAPPARCAHSTVYYNHALYVFGGEYATADEYHHYKDLWRFDIKAQSWQEIKSSVGGGGGGSSLQESSLKKKNTSSTTTTTTTTTTTAPAAAGLTTASTGTPPSARSGHVAVVWKHYMIIFGGFYEAMRADTPRWYNDVSVMNLKTHEWLAVPHSKLSVRPEPRSACNADVIGDDLIIHGGFSKLVNHNSNKLSHPPSSSLSSLSSSQLQSTGVVAFSSSSSSETRVHSDAWMLHLKPLLSNKPPTWERLTSSSRASTTTNSTDSTNLSPNGRAGTSSVAYKNRLLAYGGVIDHEAHHHKMNSVFYNDLFCLDIARRKWFPSLPGRRMIVSVLVLETSTVMSINQTATRTRRLLLLLLLM
jgi:Kelch motif/Galactose oxidase, central domain